MGSVSIYVWVSAKHHRWGKLFRPGNPSCRVEECWFCRSLENYLYYPLGSLLSPMIIIDKKNDYYSTKKPPNPSLTTKAPYIVMGLSFEHTAGLRDRVGSGQ